MKKIAIPVAAVAAVLLIAAVTAVASAQPGPGAGDERPGLAARGERMARRLGLSQEQRAQMDKLREAGREEQMALRKELMRLRHALRGEMMADEPDPQKVEKLAADIGAAQTRMRTDRLLHRLEMRKILTPEQRDRLLTMRPGHGGRAPGRGETPRWDRPGRPGRGQGQAWHPGRGRGDGPRFAPPDEDI